jgi:hypothetical protein
MVHLLIPIALDPFLQGCESNRLLTLYFLFLFVHLVYHFLVVSVLLLAVHYLGQIDVLRSLVIELYAE